MLLLYQEWSFWQPSRVLSLIYAAINLTHPSVHFRVSSLYVNLLASLQFNFTLHQGEPSDGVRTSNAINAPWQLQLPASIRNLSSSFPLSSSDNSPVIDLDNLIKSFVPPWQEAWRLCELYLDQAPWFFGAVTEKQLLEEILPLWYQEAAQSGPSKPPLNEGSSPSRASAHELALLFMIFCFGAYTDISLPAAPDNPDAEQYFQLTRAALSLEPVLERPPSVATVQALSLMAIYQGMCSGDNSIECTWALMGMATKLAQSVRCAPVHLASTSLNHVSSSSQIGLRTRFPLRRALRDILTHHTLTPSRP